MEKHMEFQEYPKALYLAGQALIVEDAGQEDAARADGYDDWHTDHARMNGDADGATGAEQPLDREELKAKAKELGIEHAPNIGTEKLAALVAAAEGK
jgi:hypothetical protein